MTQKTLTSQCRYLPDMLWVDSWLGMFCEYNLISHASAFSIRPHPLSQYVPNYRPTASPSILINLFKVATYLSCGEDY